MSVKIGDIEIPQKYGAKVRALNKVSISVSILGDQELISELLSLEKEKLYPVKSREYNGIVQIEEVKPTREEIGDQVITHIFIDSTSKSR